MTSFTCTSAIEDCCALQNNRDPTYIDHQLMFWKVSPIFSFLIWSNYGPYLNFFAPFGAIFGVGIRFKNTIVTYLHRQSTLVLKIQPYLFCFQFGHIWGQFCTFLGPSELLFGPLGIGLSKVQKQFWNLPMYKINFGFGNTALSYCF